MWQAYSVGERACHASTQVDDYSVGAHAGGHAMKSEVGFLIFEHDMGMCRTPSAHAPLVEHAAGAEQARKDVEE